MQLNIKTKLCGDRDKTVNYMKRQRRKQTQKENKKSDPMTIIEEIEILLYSQMVFALTSIYTGG